MQDTRVYFNILISKAFVQKMYSKFAIDLFEAWTFLILFFFFISFKIVAKEHELRSINGDNDDI